MAPSKKLIFDTLSRYWGYGSFRDFQEEAILSILEGRDTLTVLPTGGGKSLCFQLPALISEGMAVVVSPLLSLMKDQVDDLKELGIAAECLNSSLSPAMRFAVEQKVREGRIKLLYLSPERLVMEETLALLKEARLSFLVVDEAHCISHWGHNFREEYRQLGLLKREFENIGVHAFTATATGEVQADIVKQLNLKDPRVYVGPIDRPNLTYRVAPRRADLLAQIVEVIRRHPGEPGIVYCLRRSDVDELSRRLNAAGFPNLPYHAGLQDEERRRNQEAFSSERVPLIVATIAFGMGVDCSNIRYVAHAAMPKSIEHYQQETGRSGRDGLPAECVLFYSGADYRTWEYMLRDSAEQQVLMEKLGAMYDFCARPECRHRFLIKYFGQEAPGENCGACDYCLGEVEMVADSLAVGQKVLSCVARVNERFGADHVAEVLRGQATQAARRWGHDKLSTFGLMSGESKAGVRFMIEQLVGQGFLRRDGEYKTLAITESGRELLKGRAVPRLAMPAVPTKRKGEALRRGARPTGDPEGFDQALFSALRAKRSELAQKKGVPAYIVFSDKTLKDMARVKPRTPEEFSTVYGVGESKLKQYGAVFIEVVKAASGC